MSEPIKRYVASKVDIAIEELANLYEGGSIMASTDPVGFLRTVASDVRELRSMGIESARAEAFQMGQEEMREQCADAFFHMPAVATAIRNLPLKDKP